MQNSTIRFGWSTDLFFGMDAVSYSLKIVEVLCAFPLHVWVITTLNVKDYAISKDIRICYICDQMTMLLYGLMIGFLLEPYPIYPWPGYYCDGILCRYLDERTLSALYGFTIGAVMPFFCYMTIRLHHQVVRSTPTRLIISPRNQKFVMVAICAIALSTVPVYALFNVSVASGATIANAPELEALLARGGKLIILGPPGHAHTFAYVVAYAFVSGGSIFALLIVLSVHSMFVIKRREKMFNLSGKTQQAQDRLAVAFGLQLIAAALFYVVPVLSMKILMLFDTSNWPPAVLFTIRPLLIASFLSKAVSMSMKPSVQSAIYLSKNPELRKRSFYQLLYRLFNSIAIVDSTPVRKVATVSPVQRNTAVVAIRATSNLRT